MFKTKLALLITGLSFSLISVAQTQIGSSSNLSIEVPVAAQSTLTTTFIPAAGLIAGSVFEGNMIGQIELLTTGAGNINQVTITPLAEDGNFNLKGEATNSYLPITIGDVQTELDEPIMNGHNTSNVIIPSQEVILSVFAGGKPEADLFKGNFTVSVYSN